MRERFTLKKKPVPVTVLRLFKFLCQTEQSIYAEISHNCFFLYIKLILDWYEHSSYILRRSRDC